MKKAIEGFTVDVTPVLTVHATYVANDFVGTTNLPMTFDNCARFPGGSGWITGAVLIDDIPVSVNGELWLFDTAPAGLPADSAAFAISDADAKRCIGVIPFSSYVTNATSSIAQGTIPANGIRFNCLPTSRALYGAFKTSGTPAYTANNLTFRLIGKQD